MSRDKFAALWSYLKSAAESSAVTFVFRVVTMLGMGVLVLMGTTWKQWAREFIAESPAVQAIRVGTEEDHKILTQTQQTILLIGKAQAQVTSQQKEMGAQLIATQQQLTQVTTQLSTLVGAVQEGRKERIESDRYLGDRIDHLSDRLKP